MSAPAYAGAWPTEPGHGQAISSFAYSMADTTFNDAGDAGDATTFDKFEISTFLEYGLTSRLTLVAQPVVQSVRLGDSAGGEVSQTGFASSQLGLRWLAVRRGSSVLSLQAAAVIPGQGENVLDAPLGDGGLAGEARVLLGHGWGDAQRGAFVEGQAGYRFRGSDDPDETRFDATFGVRPSERWMIIGQSFSIWSATDDASAVRPYASHKLQLSAVRRINDRLSVQLGGYGSYAGRNVVDERAAFVAVWVSFDRHALRRRRP